MISNIILVIAIILLITLLIFVSCVLRISGKISKKEEYKNLDPKVLDDDTKEWNLEDIFIYNNEFVKKETKNEKRVEEKTIKTRKQNSKSIK